MRKYLACAGIAAVTLLAGCADDAFDRLGQEGSEELISLAAQIDQLTVSRANDDGFADGDVMGVYVVDYEGTQPGTLLSRGNHGDNVRHTFNEETFSWKSAYDLYWKDKRTRIDIYGYYPAGNPDDVNNYRFSVKTRQDRAAHQGVMGDYEASDFLWGKVGGVEPTANVIRLPLHHRMANARVTLLEGAGFAAGEWASLEKQILITNTIHDALIDLATGTVTPDGAVAPTSITPAKRGDEWRAIVVPQEIPAGTTMFSITLGGIPYKFSKPEAFSYQPGRMSNFTIRVDHKASSGDYSLTLVGESITPWEDDLVSHDATSKEYVVINSTPGGLKDAIAAAGKNYATLKNLKVTGEINEYDFDFMNREMSSLQCLNLKEVKLKGYSNPQRDEDCIPVQAFYGKTSLLRIVLPDRLKRIRFDAFYGCSNLSGSLVIPEGVIEIGGRAFSGCEALKGTLSLPSTLQIIDLDAFSGCGFISELNIPESVTEIGASAFYGCSGLYGSLRLPSKLTEIKRYTFCFCRNLTGSLEIPQSVKKIGESAFNDCGFNGTLRLHDGITQIGAGAFRLCNFRGELILPKELTVVEGNTFQCSSFSSIVFPENLVTIKGYAFSQNGMLMGVLNFPEGLISIGYDAFSYCRMIEGLVLPASLENIGSGAFNSCFYIGSITSKSLYPPVVSSGAFDGVAKDNFAVEVPEAALQEYRNTAGWHDFKRLTPHRELVCRPSVAAALSTARTQTLIVDAESEWEVESLPSWCTVTPTQGFKKTQVTLTINAMEATSGSREGDVVFLLKGKEYTTRCHVRQDGYQHGEDEFVTLQQATKGNNGGINIVVVGDGYDSRSIADGTYLREMQEAVDNFFGVEPYTTYRDYFNVYAPIALSTEKGVGTVNTIIYNRFNTTYTEGVGLDCDKEALLDYVTGAPTVTRNNLRQTLVIVIPNSNAYGGITHLWATGEAIAFCPKSDYPFPLDARGVLQHEAGGHGFAKLGDEYIYHNAFISACKCTDCGHDSAIKQAKMLGWYDNLELTGKMDKVGWKHLIFDPRYSGVVDVFEGGYMHSRGVFRSEQNSCMNNNIPYFSTISRESIVKRIKRYAGETFNFEEFVALDKTAASKARSRSIDNFATKVMPSPHQQAPVIHQGSPKLGKKRK